MAYTKITLQAGKTYLYGGADEVIYMGYLDSYFTLPYIFRYTNTSILFGIAEGNLVDITDITLTAPQTFTATPGDTQVALTWTAPAFDGGSAITGYQVSSDNGTSWVSASSDTGHTFTGLTNGTAYTFQVRAVNGNGPGPVATQVATPTA